MLNAELFLLFMYKCVCVWLTSNAYIFDVFFHRMCGYKMWMVRDGYYYHYYYMHGYCDHLDSLTFFHNVFFGPFVRYSLVGSFRLRSFFSLRYCCCCCFVSFRFLFCWYFLSFSLLLVRSPVFFSFLFLSPTFSHIARVLVCVCACVLCIDVQSNIYKRYGIVCFLGGCTYAFISDRYNLEANVHVCFLSFCLSSILSFLYIFCSVRLVFFSLLLRSPSSLLLLLLSLFSSSCISFLFLLSLSPCVWVINYMLSASTYSHIIMENIFRFLFLFSFVRVCMCVHFCCCCCCCFRELKRKHLEVWARPTGVCIHVQCMHRGKGRTIKCFYLFALKVLQVVSRLSLSHCQ